MSTIQTQASLVHLDSSIGLNSGTQLVSQENVFTSGVVEVSTAAGQTIPLGQIQVPRQVLLKFLGGDTLLVGFDGSFWPLRLAVPGEVMLLRLDVESSSQEQSTIITLPDVDRSLGGRWFDIFDSAGRVRVWFNITPGLTATGFIYYNSPAVGDTVIVDEVTFTCAASGDGVSSFSNITELTALINDSALAVSAAESPGTIELAATSPGSAGNSIGLAIGVQTGDMSVVPFSGGTDGSTAPPLPDGRLLPVIVHVNAIADAVAVALASELNADSEFSSSSVVNPVVVLDSNSDIRPPIVDGDTGFTFSRKMVVTSPPTVHLLSKGVTSLAIAVAPL